MHTNRSARFKMFKLQTKKKIICFGMIKKEEEEVQDEVKEQFGLLNKY